MKRIGFLAILGFVSAFGNEFDIDSILFILITPFPTTARMNWYIKEKIFLAS